MMLRGIGDSTTPTETPTATTSCSDLGYGSDQDYGFLWGVERWIPGYGSYGLPWSFRAQGAFSGLFDPAKWGCEPITQLGTLLLPVGAILLVFSILKKGSR